ncbi:unnamed protein product [Ixodes hexagonus]
MVSIIKNQILKHLSKFTKNLSLDKIQLSTLRGHCELRNLELDEQVLTELLELPSWLCLTRAVCNFLTLKACAPFLPNLPHIIHWTKLKYVPIHLCLDEVLVEVETCEELRPLPASKPSYSSGGRYGFSDRVVDGMKVVVNSVVINFQSAAFQASFQLSRVVLDSRTPRWEPGDLRLCRIKSQDQGEILIFKQLEWQMLRLEAHSRGDGAPAPLRLITNGARCRIVLKKRLADCSMVASRLVLILDDLLWALTDAQLVAAIHLWHSLSVLVRRSAAQRRRAAPPPVEAAPRGTLPRTHSPLVEFFRHHDVLETSYHLFCTRIDLHLCDDMDPKETRSSWPPLQGGGALQVVLEKLLVDYYPFHGVASPRAQWLKYSEPSSGRQAWVQQLLSRWAEGSRHAVLQRAPPHGATAPQDVNGSPHSQTGDWRCLMSSCLLVRLEEFAVQQVVCTSGRGARRRFLASEGATVLLPGEALHLELTYYYLRPGSSPTANNTPPGMSPSSQPGAVPEPHLFAHLGPMALRIDLTTILWAHAFLHSVRKCTEHLACTNGTVPLAVRLELILPKVCYSTDTIKEVWGLGEPLRVLRGTTGFLGTHLGNPLSRPLVLEPGSGEHRGSPEHPQMLPKLSSFPYRPYCSCYISVRMELVSNQREHAALFSNLCDICRQKIVSTTAFLPTRCWLWEGERGEEKLWKIEFTFLDRAKYFMIETRTLQDSCSKLPQLVWKTLQSILGPGGEPRGSVSLTALWPRVEVGLLLAINQPLGGGRAGGDASPADSDRQPDSPAEPPTDSSAPSSATSSSPLRQSAQGLPPAVSPPGCTPGESVPKGGPWMLRKGLASFVAGIDSVLARGAADGEADSSLADDDSVSLRSDLSSDSDQLLLAGAGVLDEVLGPRSRGDLLPELAQEATEEERLATLAMDAAWPRMRSVSNVPSRACVALSLHDLQLVAWASPHGASVLVQSQHLTLEEKQPHNAGSRGGAGDVGERCLLSLRWDWPPLGIGAQVRALVRDLAVRLSPAALGGLAQMAQEEPPTRAVPMRLLLHGLSATLLEETENGKEHPEGLLVKVPQCLVDRTALGAVYLLPTGCGSLPEAVEQLLWRSGEPHVTGDSRPDLSGLLEENERLRQRLSQLQVLQRENDLLREQVTQLETSSAGERQELQDQRDEVSRLEQEKHSLLATLQLLQEELSRLERSSGCDPFCGAASS